MYKFISLFPSFLSSRVLLLRRGMRSLCLAFASYTEIANFLQGFVDNEANLNAAASCAGVCSDYRKTAHFQCQSGSLCDRNVNDHEQAKCGGIIRDCQSIDDSDVNICETVSQIK